MKKSTLSDSYEDCEVTEMRLGNHVKQKVADLESILCLIEILKQNLNIFHSSN